MFITDEKHHKNPILANLSCDEKSICIPLPNKICNSAKWYIPFLPALPGAEIKSTVHVALPKWPIN